MSKSFLQLPQAKRGLFGGALPPLGVDDVRAAARSSLDKSVFGELLVRALHGHEGDPKRLGDTLGARELTPRQVGACGDLVSEPTGDLSGAWRLIWLPVHT